MSDLSALNTSLAMTKTAQAQAKTSAESLRRAQEMKKIEDAAQEFEAVFISEMMKPMFEGISTEAPFGGGKGEEVFRGILLQEYGKIMSQTGSVGIATQVKDAMIRMQSEADGNSSPLPQQDMQVTENIIDHPLTQQTED